MKQKQLFKIFGGAIISAISACAPMKEPSQRVTLKISSGAVTESGVFSTQAAGDFAFDDNNCYFLHISADDAIFQKFPTGEDMTCSEMPHAIGLISGLYKYGDEVGLDIPVGQNRRFDLLAIPKAAVNGLSASNGDIYAPADCKGTVTVQMGPKENNPAVMEPNLYLDGVKFKSKTLVIATGTSNIDPSITNVVTLNQVKNPDQSLGHDYGCQKLQFDNSFGSYTQMGPTVHVSGKCFAGLPMSVSVTPAVDVLSGASVLTCVLGYFSSDITPSTTTTAHSVTLTQVVNGATKTATQSYTTSAPATRSLVMVTPATFPFNVSPAAAWSPVLIEAKSGGTKDESFTENVTLRAYVNSDCTTQHGSNITNNTATAATGLATFSALQFTSVGTIYVKASSTSLSSACYGPVVVATTNSAPTIAAISDMSTGMNSNKSFSPVINDVDSALGCMTSLSATSSNPALVPHANIVISGPAPNCTGMITPLANQIGTTTITLTVTDGVLSSSTSFVLTVNAPTVAISPLNVTLEPFNNIKNVMDTSHLRYARHKHTETLLSNGKILVVGGESGAVPLSSVELFDPAANGGNGSTTVLTPLSTARRFHTATLLGSGKVLIVGGWGTGNIATSSVELYDPAANSGAGSTTTLTALSAARYQHSATLLGSGKVLIVGGWGTGNVELYDPSGIGSTSSMTSLGAARGIHTATLLSSGKVLVVGGYGGPYLSSVELYDPSANAGAGSTTMLNALATARGYHTATLLSSGKVLILGGISTSTPISSVELYDPDGNSGAGTTTTLTALSTVRAYHTATLLSSNKILLIGGVNSGGTPQVSVELYDPAANTGSGGTTPLTALPIARGFHTATLLSSDKVLILGGADATGTLSSVEIYDPSGAGTVTSPVPLSTARYLHTATVLSNGKVLLIGGMSGTTYLSSVELFDPGVNGGLGSVSTLTSLAAPRAFHTATLLSNGKVLLAGGQTSGGSYLSSVVLYDPSGAGSSTTLTPLTTARNLHTATLLSNGKVLLAGGMQSVSTYLTSVELYDPSGSGSTSTLTSLSTYRGDHTATLLSNGKILFVGGDYSGPISSVEIYDPSGSGSTTALVGLSGARYRHTASLLSSGKILITGGIGAGPAYLSSVELYDPAGGGSRTSLTSLNSSRMYHTATLLSSGKVLIAGGVNPTIIAGVELYDPAGSGSTSALTALETPRQNHTSVLLSDGRVFIYGGRDAAQVATDDWAIFVPWDTQVFTATGGTGAITIGLFGGSGTLYPSTGLFVPSATGNATIRATDTLGVHDDAVVTVH